MSFVIVERPAEGIAIIRLNRPERMNAMAFDLMIPLRELIEELSVDNSVRVVILTGTGGFCLSLSADIRVAAQDAYFRAAGINNGLTASELGLSYLLPRAIGQSRAAEIMLTGRDVDAFEAERIGLVSSVTAPEDLLATCLEMADRIKGFSHAGVEMTKRSLWASLNASSLEGHMEAEGLGQLFIRLTTQNFEEAIRARRDKRPPVFEA